MITIGQAPRTDVVPAMAEVMGPDKFQKIETADHMELAYELGRQAFTERESGRPAISNQSAMIWDTLTRLRAWRPIVGQGRLLSVA